MTKQTYYLKTLFLIFTFLGSLNLNAQYDDLYFDESAVKVETEDYESTDLIINVDELEVYSEEDEEDTTVSDSDEYDEYYAYQEQDYNIDAYGFTNRLSSLRLSGFCLPRRYNSFELLREAALNPRSRFNAPFLYAGSFAFLSPYAPYRSYSFLPGQWVLGFTTGYNYYLQRENRSYNRNTYYNPQPTSSQTRRIDIQPSVSNRTRLVDGDTPSTRRRSPARISSYRDSSSSRNSTAVSSYRNTGSNNSTTTNTTSTTTNTSSKRATRRP